MYLVGIINELDPQVMKARVLFPDKEGLVSPWLPLVVAWAQMNRAYRMPDPGEQVACLMDDNLEAGCIVGSIYGGSETPPEQSGDVAAAHFSDGTIVRHDRAAKVLTVISAGTVAVVAQKLITLTAPEVGFISAGALYVDCAGPCDIKSRTAVNIEGPHVKVKGDRVDLNP